MGLLGVAVSLARRMTEGFEPLMIHHFKETKMLTRYQRLKEELDTTGTGTMTSGGGSMTPIFPAKTNIKLTYQRQDDYEVGDIVFTKVKGRWIDAPSY